MALAAPVRIHARRPRKGPAQRATQIWQQPASHSFRRTRLYKWIVAPHSTVRKPAFEMQAVFRRPVSPIPVFVKAAARVRSSADQPRWRNQMWILLLVSVAIADPPHSRFAPAFHSAEFSTRESCENAKAVLEKSFGSDLNKLNAVIESSGSVGQARSYERLLFQTFCVPK